jgi:hypothetical protein
MSEPKYSDFTLNFNPGARGNDKAPTLRGKSKVIDTDGTATEFDVAAWGPNKAQSGGPDFYNVTFTPKDPAHAARQLKTEIDGPVRNAIDGFELTKLGSGRLFERTDDEIAKSKAGGKSLPKFDCHGPLLTDATPTAAVGAPASAPIATTNPPTAGIAAARATGRRSDRSTFNSAIAVLGSRPTI